MQRRKGRKEEPQRRAEQLQAQEQFGEEQEQFREEQESKSGRGTESGRGCRDGRGPWCSCSSRKLLLLSFAALLCVLCAFALTPLTFDAAKGQRKMASLPPLLTPFQRLS